MQFRKVGKKRGEKQPGKQENGKLSPPCCTIHWIRLDKTREVKYLDTAENYIKLDLVGSTVLYEVIIKLCIGSIGSNGWYLVAQGAV